MVVRLRVQGALLQYPSFISARRQWLRITSPLPPSVTSRLLLFRLSPSFHLPFESCLPFSIALCLHSPLVFFPPFLLFVLLTVTMSAAVGGFTRTFSCRLSPHLQAILPGPGNLSWVAALGTDVFDATCRGKKALKVTPFKTCQLHDEPGLPRFQEFCQSLFSPSLWRIRRLFT